VWSARILPVQATPQEATTSLPACASVGTMESSLSMTPAHLAWLEEWTATWTRPHDVLTVTWDFTLQTPAQYVLVAKLAAVITIAIPLQVVEIVIRVRTRTWSLRSVWIAKLVSTTMTFLPTHNALRATLENTLTLRARPVIVVHVTLGASSRLFAPVLAICASHALSVSFRAMAAASVKLASMEHLTKTLTRQRHANAATTSKDCNALAPLCPQLQVTTWN
jgi:hypothetical protein